MSEETVPTHPYLKLLGESEAVEVLSASPARLDAVLARVSPEQAERRPAPGKWNLREIITHMSDCEIAWSWRFRQILGGENAQLQAFDQDAWAKSYGSYSLDRAHATWEALRGWNVALLSGLSERDWERTATHPEIGSLSLRKAAGIAAGHDLHHLQSMEHVVTGF